MDGRQILEQLASIPVSTWNYRARDDSIRHMPSKTRDFYAAFGLGLGEKGIDTIDADGVAPAAIHGMNEKLAAKEVESAELSAELASLKSTVAMMAERDQARRTKASTWRGRAAWSLTRDPE